MLTDWGRHKTTGAVSSQLQAHPEVQQECGGPAFARQLSKVTAETFVWHGRKPSAGVGICTVS